MKFVTESLVLIHTYDCRTTYLYCLKLLLAQQRQNPYGCNGTDTFVKVSGYSPPQGDLIPLYVSPGHAITRECFQR